jgi:hypothetical protein
MAPSASVSSWSISVGRGDGLYADLLEKSSTVHADAEGARLPWLVEEPLAIFWTVSASAHRQLAVCRRNAGARRRQAH